MGNNKSLDDNAIAKSLSMVMATNMKDRFKTELKKAIEDTEGSKSSKFLDIITLAGKDDAPIEVKNSGKIVSYKIQSTTGFLKIPIYTTTIFRDEGLTFRLSGFDNSNKEHARKIEDELIKDHYNLPVEDELKSAVTVKSIKKYKGCSRHIGDTCVSNLIINETKVTNNTKIEIESVDFYLYPSEDLNTTKYLRFVKAENIKPKKLSHAFDKQAKAKPYLSINDLLA